MSAPMDERRAAATLERALSRMESGWAPEPALDGVEGAARAGLEAEVALAGALRAAELPPLPAEDVERIGAALSEAAAGGAGRPPSSGGASIGRALWVLAALGLLLGLLGGAWWRERGATTRVRSTSSAEAPAPSLDRPVGSAPAGSDAAGTDGPRRVLVPEPTLTASAGGRLPKASPRPLRAERTERRATAAGARAGALATASPTSSPTASRTPGATALAADPGAPTPGPSPGESASPTPSRPAARPSPTTTASPAPARSATPTATRTATPSPTASATPPPTPSPTASPTGTGTPSPSPTPDEAWLEVRVTDRDGLPIAGAAVEAPAEDGGAGASAETDGDGVARLGLRAGVGYRVRAAAEGFWPRWYDDVETREDATVVLLNGGAVEDIAIRLGRQAAGAAAETVDAPQRGPGAIRPTRSRSGARPTSPRVGVPRGEDGAGGDARADARFAISRRPA